MYFDVLLRPVEHTCWGGGGGYEKVAICKHTFHLLLKGYLREYGYKDEILYKNTFFKITITEV